MVDLLATNTDSVRAFLALLAYYLPRTLLFVAFMPLLGKGSNSGLIKSAIGIAIVLLPVQIAFASSFPHPVTQDFVVFTLVTEVMLAFAVLLSGPILIIIMLVEFAMEILSSFTPQMQVYSLQFGLRSVFGIAGLILVLEFAEEEIFRIFGDYSTTLSTLLGLVP